VKGYKKISARFESGENFSAWHKEACKSWYFYPTGLFRWNHHFHCIVLIGGIDKTGSLHHIHITDIAKLTDILRMRMIKHIVDSGIIRKNTSVEVGYARSYFHKYSTNSHYFYY